MIFDLLFDSRRSTKSNNRPNEDIRAQMNDPYVKSLSYIVTAPSVNIDYGITEPLEFENDLGIFRLANCVLTVEPADHYPEVERARFVVDSFLRSWEVMTDLTQNVGQLAFTYDTAIVIDRNPLPPGAGQTIRVQGIESLKVVSDKVTLKITCSRYPSPPEGFASTPDVELFHARWLQFREGKESLQSMSYFIFHGIFYIAGNLADAATMYKISTKVFKKIRFLSSRKGDPLTARKFDYVEMTAAEEAWLAAAVKTVIIRVGQHAAGASLHKITMADLPKLD